MSSKTGIQADQQPSPLFPTRACRRSTRSSTRKAFAPRFRIASATDSTTVILPAVSWLQASKGLWLSCAGSVSSIWVDRVTNMRSGFRASFQSHRKIQNLHAGVLFVSYHKVSKETIKVGNVAFGKSKPSGLILRESGSPRSCHLDVFRPDTNATLYSFSFVALDPSESGVKFRAILHGPAPDHCCIVIDLDRKQLVSFKDIFANWQEASAAAEKVQVRATLHLERSSQTDRNTNLHPAMMHSARIRLFAFKLCSKGKFNALSSHSRHSKTGTSGCANPMRYLRRWILCDWRFLRRRLSVDKAPRDNEGGEIEPTRGEGNEGKAFKQLVKET